MERPARSGAAARRSTKVRQRDVELSVGERSPCGILIENVRQDIELDGLHRHGVRLLEVPSLIQREIELTEQHRVRGAVEGSPGGKSTTCVDRARASGPSGHRLA